MFFEFFIHLLIIISVYAVLAVSFNFIVGQSGFLNLSHVSFWGVGAYASVVLTDRGFDLVSALGLAGLSASIFGFLLMLGAHRLKDDYFAMAGLAFGLILISLFRNLDFITGGTRGIFSVSDPEFLGFAINSHLEYLLIVLIVSIISIFLMVKIIYSPYGRVLRALKQNEKSLLVFGKNTFKLKLQAMMFSAFFAGVSGALYAHYIGYIHPESFSFSELILIVTILIVGGLSSVKGTLVATVLVIAFSEVFIRFVPLPVSILGPLRQLIFLSLLIGFIFIKPRGGF